MKITSEGFSFHTMTLKRLISYEEYVDIKERLYTILKMYPGEIYLKENIIISEQFKKQGVIIKIKRNKNKPTYLELRVNPRIAIGIYDYKGIFPCNKDNIVKINIEISKILNIIGSSYVFEDMILSRIDLCVNIDTEDREITNTYMRLFKKCAIPSNYSRDKFDNITDNYKEKNNNSFRANSQSTSLTIYNKAFQVEQERLDGYGDYCMGEIIRIEVELKRSAINEIAQKYSYYNNLGTNQEIMSFMGNHSKIIIKDFLLKFFLPGRYLTYSDVRDIILQTKYKNKIINRMLKLLKKTSECKNFDEAISKIKKEYGLSEYQIKNILVKYNEIGINPITIKNSQSNICILPGIYEMLDIC